MYRSSPIAPVALAASLTIALPVGALASEPSTTASTDSPDAPVPVAPGTVTLQLETKNLDDDLETELRTHFDAEVRELLKSNRYAEVEGSADLAVRITVAAPDPDEALHLVSVVATDVGGQTVLESREEVCMRCEPAALARECVRPLEAAVFDGARGSSAPAPTVVSDSPEPDRTNDSSPPPGRRPGPLTWAGIGVGAAGLGAAIAGGVLLHRGEVGGGLTVQDYRPAGLATLSTGLGLLVVGQVLVTVDFARAASGKRKRDRSTARVDGIAPMVMRGAGLSVSGSF